MGFYLNKRENNINTYTYIEKIRENLALCTMLLPPCHNHIIGDFPSDDFFSSGVLSGGGMYHHHDVPQAPEDLLMCTDERIFNNDRTPPDQDYQAFTLPSSTTSGSCCITNSLSTDSLRTSFPHMIEGLDSSRQHTTDSCQSLTSNTAEVDRSNDLQWLVTTSNTDQQTITSVPSSSPQTPQFSSNTPSSAAMYPSEDRPKSQEQQGSSVATITHQAFSPSQFMPATEGPSETKPMDTTKRRVTAGRTTSKSSSSATPAKPKGTPGRKREVPDHVLTPAEANKRHIRRERNKLAAAKCRNRRRELTDRLQGQTDQLEEDLHQLNMEVQALLQEKERLEFILADNAPQCKAGINDNLPPQVSNRIHAMEVNPALSAHEPYPGGIPYPRLEPPASLNIINQQRVMGINHTNSPSPSSSLKLFYPPTTPVASALGVPRPRYLPVEPSTSNFERSNDPSLNTPVCTLVTPTNPHDSYLYNRAGPPPMKVSPMGPFVETPYPVPHRPQHPSREAEFSPPMNMSSSSGGGGDVRPTSFPVPIPQGTRSREQHPAQSPKLLNL